MKINDIITALNLTLISGKGGISNEITGGYVSDLLSDVIGSASEGNAWITIQTHNNIIAVASLKEISAIIIAKGLQPAEETIRKSESENIPLLSTSESAFTISGRLFELLKKE
jgi:serine kinase of HPr protein (carbohydrate metabolism regulator)